MKRLLCLLNGHRWNPMTRACARCHAHNTALLLIDALKPVIDAAARATLAWEAVYRLQAEPPKLEVLRRLSEEEQLLLEMGVKFPNLRHNLPRHLQDMLAEEERDSVHTADH